MVTETGARPRERLSRARIVETALAVMDADGLDAVTMRRLARELGVEPMSLYNHVRDKDDLLGGIRERVLADFPYPELDERDWFGSGRRVARAWRDLLRSHPGTLELLAEKHTPATSTEALQPMECALNVLRHMGLSDQEAVQAFHAFGGYIQGFVLMERQMDFARDRGGSAAQQLAGAIDADELPCVVAALPYLAECDLDAQFEYGLDLLLEGLRTRAARSRPTAVPASANI